MNSDKRVNLSLLVSNARQWMIDEGDDPDSAEQYISFSGALEKYDIPQHDFWVNPDEGDDMALFPDDFPVRFEEARLGQSLMWEGAMLFLIEKGPNWITLAALEMIEMDVPEFGSINRPML